MLFTSSSMGGDWQNHLWFLWEQSSAIRANHAPSPFLSTPHMAFYPEYFFYGGTLHVLAAVLALILGNSATAAYVLTYIAGFGAAYGGWYWIGRMAGLTGWASHAPGVAFVTSACYLTIVYGQGDWPEFLAMSVIPLMIAAALSVLRARHLQPWPFAALASSVVVFFGSHNLTMLWGSTILAITGLLIVICVPEARRLVRPRRLMRIAGVLVPAALVNAWFLLPALAYQSNTRAVVQRIASELELSLSMRLVSFGHLFTLSRATSAPPIPDYALPLPTLVIIWVILGLIVVLASGHRGMWVRLLAVLCAVTVALIVLMTHLGAITALPKPYTLLEFSYRLESYILMSVSGAALVILVLAQKGSRKLRLYGWALAPILAGSVIGAVQQVSAYPRTVPRSTTFTQGSEAEKSAELHNDYSYASLPLVFGPQLPLLSFSPNQIHDDRATAYESARPGQLVYTNIGGGPDLLDITGARVVGRDPSFRLVLALGPDTARPSAQPQTPVTKQRVTIGPAQSPPVAIGRLLSFGSVGLLALELAWLVIRRRRRSVRG